MGAMPTTTKHHYNLPRLRVIFACASVALLASLIWLIKVDHDRPWRRFQADHAELQVSLAYLDILAAETDADRDAARERYEAWSRGRGGLFNLPLFDFAAPSSTPGHAEIRQIVLPDVRRDLHFAESATTDRCMTCHVGIDDPQLTTSQLARPTRAGSRCHERFAVDVTRSE